MVCRGQHADCDRQRSSHGRHRPGIFGLGHDGAVADPIRKVSNEPMADNPGGQEPAESSRSRIPSNRAPAQFAANRRSAATRVVHLTFAQAKSLF